VLQGSHDAGRDWARPDSRNLAQVACSAFIQSRAWLRSLARAASGRRVVLALTAAGQGGGAGTGHDRVGRRPAGGGPGRLPVARAHGNDHLKRTHPDRLRRTHLGLQDSRYGQGRQVWFTPTFDPSWLS
jgi:hypothetical protein